ncbi:hypothetical protein PALU110988_24810 [Paenibacillus lupini]|jgi:hypothetical protein|uniref:hypothetical protein n=1 Tax=Paenibacillus lupini TaxID=1450204 RepID=UPI00141DF743|nr:hypothetical protein [Paenibacillus lupini]NIK24720.1 ABC-type multidrug transport system permease subunit [Paenibacillus lupini]
MGSANVIFVISAFVLGGLVILKRDSMAPRLRKWMAIFSIVLIAFAFFLIVWSFFTLGT